MKAKTLFKGFIVLSFVSLFGVGVYAVVKRIGTMDIFTVSSVEIRGVINADRAKLDKIGQRLIGLNIFYKDMETLLNTSDPWVQKITASRVLPDGINIKVYEEKPLFAFKDKTNKCYMLTQGKKKISSSCDDVKIVMEKNMTDDQAFAFADLLESNPYLRSMDIKLKDYSWVAQIDGNLIYCPYDKKIFDENYNVFSSKLKKLYKTIDYVDLTIDKRIFIKGARHESNGKG